MMRWKALPLVVAVLAPPALHAQSALFGIDYNQVTSFGSDFFRPDFHGTNLPFRAYSLFDNGTTRFVYFLQNQNTGAPIEWEWPGTSIYSNQVEITEGSGSYGFVGTIFANDPWFHDGFSPRLMYLPVDLFPGWTTSGYEFDFWAMQNFYGCNVPDVVPNNGEFFQTCPQQGYDGWLRFEVAAEGFHTLEAIDAGTFVTDNVNVTPEPLTMLLFGTGLAGVAAARRKRRRNESDA